MHSGRGIVRAYHSCVYKHRHFGRSISYISVHGVGYMCITNVLDPLVTRSEKRGAPRKDLVEKISLPHVKKY
jgi:hypothetical protein